MAAILSRGDELMTKLSHGTDNSGNDSYGHYIQDTRDPFY